MNKKIIYYFFFLYMSSRKLLSNLNLIHNSQFHFEIIKNSKFYFYMIIFIQLPVCYFLYAYYSIAEYEYTYITPTKAYLLGSFIVGFFSILFNRIGVLSFCLFLIYHLESVLLKLYLNASFTEPEISHIYSNFNYSILSLLCSIFFIISVYTIANDSISKIYFNIYKRIFLIKLLFDLALIISYIYNLYSEFNNDYIAKFNSTYQIIFILFSFHYVMIFLSLWARLNFKIEDKTIESYFDNLSPYIKKEGKDISDGRTANYNKFTPYFELKFYKVKM
jgi:hypothetical protein